MTTFWFRNAFQKLSSLRSGTLLRRTATSGLVAFVLFTGLVQGHQASYWKPSSSSSVCIKGDSKKMSTKIPCAYIPHGGGPLPILGDGQHVEMVNWLKTFSDTYLIGATKPSSCLVVSAHWEAKQATVQSGATNKLYYDYYGFPEESYNLNYTLPGATTLAKRVGELLEAAKIPYSVNDNRGFDHGVFIPMKIIFPDGEIPTIQISLVAGLDPKTHIQLGEALAPLREEGVFILGSGMSYHNMAGFNHPGSNKDSEPFHEYLRNSLAQSKTYEQRMAALEKWAQAPRARQCHPREEHLIPLLVILGATKGDPTCRVKETFYAKVAGVKCAGYVFQ